MRLDQRDSGPVFVAMPIAAARLDGHGELVERVKEAAGLDVDAFLGHIGAKLRNGCRSGRFCRNGLSPTKRDRFGLAPARWRAREVGVREVGVREVGAREVGAREVGVREVGVRRLAPAR